VIPSIDPVDTVFETEEWCRFVERRFGFLYAPIRVTLPSGETVLIPCNVVETRFQAFRVLRSTPPDHFGNVYSSRQLSLPLLLDTFQTVSRLPFVHSLTIAFHPLHRHADVIRSLPDQYVLSHRGATRVLELSMPFDRMWETVFCKQHRRKIRTALKRGVHVGVDVSDAGIEAYYPLYVESCRRLELAHTEPIEYFYDLKAALPAFYSLWLARVDGQTVAGLIVLIRGCKVYAYQMSSSERHWDLYPNHLLFSTIIEHACAIGAEYIDFLPTGFASGPETFKERFGARRLPYFVYRVHNRYYHRLAQWKRALAGATSRSPAEDEVALEMEPGGLEFPVAQEEESA
jgi:hypothetical protein